MNANIVPGSSGGEPVVSDEVDAYGSEGPQDDADPDAPQTGAPDAGPPPGDLIVADPAVHRLVAAVDQLTDLTAQPVDEHAARFREVHNVLQDALSDTDGNGSQPS